MTLVASESVCVLFNPIANGSGGGGGGGGVPVAKFMAFIKKSLTITS